MLRSLCRGITTCAATTVLVLFAQTNLQAKDFLAELREQEAAIEVDEQRPGKPVVKLTLTRPATDEVMNRLGQLSELRELAVYGPESL